MDSSYFDQNISRFGTNSFKWDFKNVYFHGKDVIPLHVADMDFLSAPEIVNALKQRVEKDCFGYSINSSEHFVYLANWLKKRHNWEVDPKWCLHSPSAVCAIALVLNAFTKEGDGVIVHTPSYPHFLSTILGFKRKLLVSELIENDSYYTMDYEDFEEKCKMGAKVFIFCSPHNPTGRVWTEEEIKTITSLCLKYNVLIISDELHGDITYKAKIHIPTAMISNEVSSKTFTLCSPSKTFNLAGLATSSVIVENKELRTKLELEFEKFHLYIPNAIGNVAFDVAYSKGEEWYQTLLLYLNENKKLIEDFFKTNLSHIPISKSESTYLSWINFKYLNKSPNELKNLFHNDLKLGLESGARFGKGGENYMRLNFGLPRNKLLEVLNIFKSAFSLK